MDFKRYIRQINLSEIGQDGQSTLYNSKVAIIGAGGLGIPAALYLAGAGVGKIEIFDFDKIELSNLHRQVIYTEDDIDKYKAEVLSFHINRMNSSIECNAHTEMINENNALTFLKESDIILDCSDNTETRYIINDACVLLNKAFVSASIYKYEGQLGLFNYNEGPTYRCLYERSKNSSNIASCEEVGVLATLPGIMGALQANETLKCLLNIGVLLSGKIMITSSLNYNTSIYDIERNEDTVNKVKRHGINYDKDLFDSDIDIDNVALQKLISEDDCVLIDVREENEMPFVDDKKIIKMPMSKGFNPDLITNKKNIICFCQSGIRSQGVAKYLRNEGFKAYNLIHGMSELELSGLFEFKYEKFL